MDLLAIFLMFVWLKKEWVFNYLASWISWPLFWCLYGWKKREWVFKYLTSFYGSFFDIPFHISFTFCSIIDIYIANLEQDLLSISLIEPVSKNNFPFLWLKVVIIVQEKQKWIGGLCFVLSFVSVVAMHLNFEVSIKKQHPSFILWYLKILNFVHKFL